ncbi:sensor histidine kinase [Pedobacter glucosidilyticus]|uniref:sensor histidine kinase n=1 Tax=Pedobacter glucosidilyticus TaxID=1122941 RepID=UPI0003FF9E0F|nr:HAMP domain-containing sensor histidine kinase [Pedobacter glucosidilyticus]
MTKVYTKLHDVKFLKKSYSLKFLFISFLGIHIPLIGIIIFLLIVEGGLEKSTIILITLVLTLIATASTLLILNSLIKPLIYSKNALQDYISDKKLPHLPTHYKDEAGVLMSLIQQNILQLDGLLKENREITTLLSHNLRSPLLQIKGLCHVLEIQKIENKDIVDKIDFIAGTQLKNIDELLLNLKYHYLDHDTEHKTVDLKKLVKHYITLTKTEADKKEIEIVEHFCTEETMTFTNEHKLGLVIQNLLSNAIKFSYPKSKVIVELKPYQNKFKIEVKDNGLGFTADFAKKLFTNSATVGRVGTSGEPTIGLGLSLSKKTIEQMGGKLKAHSDGENKGATFSLII